MKQLDIFGTLEEAEAIAMAKSSRVRDKAVRLLQYEVREGREATEAIGGTQSGDCKTQ